MNQGKQLWFGSHKSGLHRLSFAGFQTITWPSEDIIDGFGPMSGSHDTIWFVKQCSVMLFRTDAVKPHDF